MTEFSGVDLVEVEVVVAVNEAVDEEADEVVVEVAIATTNRPPRILARTMTISPNNSLEI